ncbi:DUF2339 domain-containing protein [Pseudomonas sp. TTU2014-080ASC]|uniref:DUF2339 domain-containing protein n=1 Tax=Pseudomonas sp. TTU2014-080ASC TaxID=1729724 RepID=UPI0007189A69|nr:DUF2339 domain-containing protein [Pseudomonas sp. TTU2014-080ASC]KRW58981.1 hypothetical protein AO726_15850 [Pseudomonas sp. TTU2014-080ASC]
MQWVYMAVGLVLGALADETLSSALIGALLGLGIGQALKLRGLERENNKLESQLKVVSTQFEQSANSLKARLDELEKAPVSALQTLPDSALPALTPVTPEVAEPDPALAQEADDKLDLDWTLDFDQLQHSTPDSSEQDSAAQWNEPASAESRQPTLIERGYAAAKNWLLGGNTVLRVGVVLLFLGLAFLLRYATEGVVVPVELRYAGVAASALALLGLGWWLRKRNPNYALMVQGAGVAVLYLTVFAAMRLHPLLDPSMAFAMLVLVTLFSAILAVKQDALVLAAAAALGGFAAPILASTGSGSHVALFSYFALLNTGIFAIAWFKAWRQLNLIGMVGTFSIGLAWGLRSYTPELLWSTEPFLILFFLMYVAIGLLFARRKLREAEDAPSVPGEMLRWAARKGDYIDASVLFGPPLVGFGLQFAVVQHIEFAAAFSALGLGLFYLLLARLLVERTGNRAALLVETCLALGVVFASLAIPLGLDANWTSAVWALEGAGIYWLGLRQQRKLARAFALLLQFGAALAFLIGLRPGDSTLLDGSALGALMLAVALLFSYWQLRHSGTELSTHWERRGISLLASSGLGFFYLIAPLLFAVQGTATCWAVAGLLTLWIGLRLPARSFLLCAFAVQLLGGLLFLAISPLLGHLNAEGLRPLAHGDFWAPLVLGITALVGAWKLQQQAQREGAISLGNFSLLGLSQLLMLWGAAWWALALSSEVLRFVDGDSQASALLLVLTGSVALAAYLAGRVRWTGLGVLCCLLTPLAGVVLLYAWHEQYHPAANWGWLAWGLLFAVHFWSLRRLAGLLPSGALSTAHVLGCWLLLGVLSLELRYLFMSLAEHYNAWRWLGWALLPSAYLWLMSLHRRWPWPLAAYPREYQVLAAAPLALLLLGWFWLANVMSAGDAEPLGYLPLLNPLELGLLFALGAVFLWAQKGLPVLGMSVAHSRVLNQAVLGASLFALLTAMVMRTVHHWAAVPYELNALLDSMLVQAGLSIVWTLIALPLMVFGNRRGKRELWLIGAVLIALVVAKLFFVELGNRGGLERIVSFIGVGVLLLIVGYFAPLPARKVGMDKSQEPT